MRTLPVTGYRILRTALLARLFFLLPGLAVVHTGFAAQTRVWTIPDDSSDHTDCINLNMADARKSAHWVIEGSESVTLNIPGAHAVEVTLLHSREPISSDGAGNCLLGARLLVNTGGLELYRFEPDSLCHPLVMFQDVIGDGTPQVIFISGDCGGDGSEESHVHVIRLDPPNRSPGDVASQDFQYGDEGSLNWFEAGNHTYGIVADPTFDDCIRCAHRYDYHVFGWNEAAQKFMLLITVKGSTRKFEDGEQAYRANSTQIIRVLTALSGHP